MTETAEYSHFVLDTGGSRSFPETHQLIAGSLSQVDGADTVFIIGLGVNEALQQVQTATTVKAIVVELASECLGVYTGESRATEGNHILGFNRFRMGDDPPSNLVELVRQPNSDRQAITAATTVLKQHGLEVSLCQDHAGRILDRLLRPYFNETLKRLDEGLATADDMDLTLKLGLGYPEGPVTLLERSGLHHHAQVSEDLFAVYAERAYAPARRARVARQRHLNQSAQKKDQT